MHFFNAPLSGYYPVSCSINSITLFLGGDYVIANSIEGCSLFSSMVLAHLSTSLNVMLYHRTTSHGE